MNVANNKITPDPLERDGPYPCNSSIRKPRWSTCILADAGHHDAVIKAKSFLGSQGISCCDSHEVLDQKNSEQAVQDRIDASRNLLVLWTNTLASDSLAMLALEKAAREKLPVFVVWLELVQLDAKTAALLGMDAVTVMPAQDDLVNQLGPIVGDLASGTKSILKTNDNQKNGMNNDVPERSKSNLVPWAISALLGIALIALGVFYALPPTGVAIDSMATPELVESLLGAIDMEDYAAVQEFATRLFAERRDLEIADYSGKLYPPILAAAREGDLQLFEALANAKPIFGLEDARGREAIHIAAEEGYADLVRFLVEQIKVNVDDRTDGTGLTPLHWAASSGRESVIMCLIGLNADVNSVTNLGKTSLHLAIEHQQRTSFEALIQAPGIKIDAADANGLTPLHYAAKEGNLPFAQQLLLHGADPSVTDLYGRTPGQVALEAGHDSLAEHLRLRTIHLRPPLETH